MLEGYSLPSVPSVGATEHVEAWEMGLGMGWRWARLEGRGWGGGWGWGFCGGLPADSAVYTSIVLDCSITPECSFHINTVLTVCPEV